MKNKVWFVCIIILLIVAACLILFFINYKAPANIEKFQANMQNSGFIVKDISSSYKKDSSITKVVSAIKDDYNYQISFFEYNNEENAKAGFTKNLANLETYKTSKSDVEKKSSKSHYEKCELITGDKLRILCRNKNSLIYVDGSVSQKDEIFNTLSKYGL